MVALTRIYTKGGDRGQTSLGDGSRVAKHDRRVAAYGTVDEANATLGIVRLHTAGSPEHDAMLARMQNELFDLGADLCRPGDGTGDEVPVCHRACGEGADERRGARGADGESADGLARTAHGSDVAPEVGV